MIKKNPNKQDKLISSIVELEYENAFAHINNIKKSYDRLLKFLNEEHIKIIGKEYKDIVESKDLIFNWCELKSNQLMYMKEARDEYEGIGEDEENE